MNYIKVVKDFYRFKKYTMILLKFLNIGVTSSKLNIMSIMCGKRVESNFNLFDSFQEMHPGPCL